MFAVAACDDASSEPVRKENRATTISKDASGIRVYRFDDTELGVVCYRAESHDGLYCLRKPNNGTTP